MRSSAEGGPPALRSRRDLRDYQAWLARKIIEAVGVLLAVEMSMGKTAAVLTAVRRLLDEFEISKVLVIAPLRVAQETWPDEIAAWTHTRVLSYSLLTGDEKTRLRALRQETDIHIINRENVPWLWRTLGEQGWDYDMIVYDESSRLKAGRRRTKGGKKTGRRLSEFGSLARARKLVSRVVELSGTPAPGGLHNLWAQAYLLDLGERLGTSRTAFEKRWFDSDYMGWSLTPKPNAEDEILGRLKDVMFSLDSKDYLDLPPVVANPVYVQLPSKIMEEYRRFERTLVSETYDVEAVSRGALTNKLLQFANGSMYRNLEGEGPKRREVVEVHDRKIAALESVVEEANGEPILLAYSFRFDLERIKKKYPKAVLFEEDSDFVKNWNKGRIRLGVAHPASVGHGLNLQFGGHHACWYGLPWSLELYKQFNARLPRPGQRHDRVFIHHIMARGTADETVFERLSAHAATQDSINRAVVVRVRQNAKERDSQKAGLRPLTASPFSVSALGLTG